MEESVGPQFALQVAVQTMKERCLQLQQRLSIVEEENMNLRVKYHTDGVDLSQDNKSEVELLHQKIAQLSKQKSQLTHNVLMVATENRHLWNRLSKLTQANQTLGAHLTKINSTLTQSTQSSQILGQNSQNSQLMTQSAQTPATNSPSALIRSKTFTHETPPPKLVRKTEGESYTDASLEDISLKIINSIAQEKYELEKQCAQMAEMQSSDSFISTSIGFAYPQDELHDCTVGEMAQNMEKLIHIKDSLIGQREKLKQGFELLKNMIESDEPCKKCRKRQKEESEKKKKMEGNSSLETNKYSTSSRAGSSIDGEKVEKMCPMCNKTFVKETLGEFVKHVENHFVGEDDAFLDHFEVIPSVPVGGKK